MGLRDVVIPTMVIEAPGSEFTVRGISLADIQTVAVEYGPQMMTMFNKVTSGEDITTGEVKAVITQLLPQASDLCAAIIAVAADDYSGKAIAIAKRLSFHKQTEALEAIFNLTFTSEAELGKFMGSIIRMLQGANFAMEQMRLPLSELGGGAFVDK